MRQMLAPRLPQHVHLFSNILDIFGDGLAVHSAFMDLSEYNAKLELAFKLPRHPSAWCETHGQRCEIATNCGARVGGTPCQDWSTAGLGQGLNGPQFPCLLAFGAKSVYTQTPVAVLECVSGLPTDVVGDCFDQGVFNWPLQVQVSPADVGFGCTSRPRLAFLDLQCGW